MTAHIMPGGAHKHMLLLVMRQHDAHAPVHGHTCWHSTKLTAVDADREDNFRIRYPDRGQA